MVFFTVKRNVYEFFSLSKLNLNISTCPGFSRRVLFPINISLLLRFSLYFLFSLREEVQRHVSVDPRPWIWSMGTKKGQHMRCLYMKEEGTPSGQGSKRKQKHLQNRTRSEIFIYLQSHYFYICRCGDLGQIPLRLLVSPKETSVWLTTRTQKDRGGWGWLTWEVCKRKIATLTSPSLDLPISRLVSG